MTEEARGLSEEARALLLRTQEGQGPPPGMANRQLAAVQARVQAGHAGPRLDDVTAAGKATPWATKALLGSVAAVTLGVAAVASWPQSPATEAGSTQAPGVEIEPASIAEKVEAPAGEPAQNPVELEGVVPEAPGDEEREKRSRTRARPRRAHQSQTNPVVQDETYGVRLVEAELALVRPAQRALTADQPATALRLLEEHARRFPSGSLAKEREVSRVVALCRLGRVGEANRARARFLTAHPKTTYRRRLDEACRGANAVDTQ